MSHLTDTNTSTATATGTNYIDTSFSNHCLKHHHKDTDSIKSGESKFKIYSFENPIVDNHDNVKCLDFWMFIENSGLEPVKAYKLDASVCEAPPDNVICDDEHDELDWNKALALLQDRNLEKVAFATKETNGCRFCNDEKTNMNGDLYPTDDSFDLGLLNDWDPQRKYFTTVEIQTDFIPTADAEAQTDFPTEKELNQSRISNALTDLDNLLIALADMYEAPSVCICEAKECVCIFDASKPSVHGDFQTEKRDKCTCTCGEPNCLCTQCEQIMTEIEFSNDEFEKLEAFEIQKCPCSNVTCVCLADYELLLETKLEVQKMLAKNFGDDAKLGLPIPCKCVCNQPNCPCQILLNLYGKIDKIMEGNYLSHKEQVEVFNVCDCEEICTCREYVKEALEKKLQTWKKPEVEVVCKCVMPDLDEASTENESRICLCSPDILADEAASQEFTEFDSSILYPFVESNEGIRMPKKNYSVSISDNTISNATIVNSGSMNTIYSSHVVGEKSTMVNARMSEISKKLSFNLSAHASQQHHPKKLQPHASIIKHKRVSYDLHTQNSEHMSKHKIEKRKDGGDSINAVSSNLPVCDPLPTGSTSSLSKRTSSQLACPREDCLQKGRVSETRNKPIPCLCKRPKCIRDSPGRRTALSRQTYIPVSTILIEGRPCSCKNSRRKSESSLMSPSMRMVKMSSVNQLLDEMKGENLIQNSLNFSELKFVDEIEKMRYKHKSGDRNTPPESLITLERINKV